MEELASAIAELDAELDFTSLLALWDKNVDADSARAVVSLTPIVESGPLRVDVDRSDGASTVFADKEYVPLSEFCEMTGRVVNLGTTLMGTFTPCARSRAGRPLTVALVFFDDSSLTLAISLRDLFGFDPFASFYVM